MSRSSAPQLGIGLAVPAAPPFSDLVRARNLASRLNLDALVVSDHLEEFAPPGHATEPAYDARVVLGALAKDADVRLGVCVTDVIRHHPALVAQSFLTLAAIGGRAPILGIGAGERLNLAPIGMDVADPVARLERTLPVLRASLSASGDAGAGALGAPSEGAPALWLGAHGPRMLALAGTYTDGWYPADIIDPDDYGARWAMVRAAAESAGRDPQSITPAAELVVVAAHDDDAAFRKLHEPEIRAAGLLLPASAWRAVGARHPLGEEARGFVDVVPRELDPCVVEEVPVELLTKHVLWGSPTRIADSIRALAQAGLRHVNLAFGPIRSAETCEPVAEVVHAIRGSTSSLPRKGLA